MKMLDLLIVNGLVIDGTASPGFHAAVGVKDEAVSIHRGDVFGLEAARVIDATGHVVCPGFVDLHSHAGIDYARRAASRSQGAAGRDDRTGWH